MSKFCIQMLIVGLCLVLGQMSGPPAAGQESGEQLLPANPAMWLNSPPLTADGLRGKVVLVDFWTYSCVNCLRTLPYVRAWYDKYKGQGLVVIGVHAPEFAFETWPSTICAFGTETRLSSGVTMRVERSPIETTSP